MEYSAISSMTIEDFWKEYVDKKVPRDDYAYITEGSSSITKKEEKIENYKEKCEANIGQYRDILIDAMGKALDNTKSYEQPFFDDPDFDCSQHMTKSLLWIAAGDAVAAPHRIYTITLMYVLVERKNIIYFRQDFTKKHRIFLAYHIA